ncbi:Serine/threonine-protein kinase HT1 [Hordeum vulgare]|nr:Serine/threonine-protein kinase HT1 [Hordeum vulgare]
MDGRHPRPTKRVARSSTTSPRMRVWAMRRHTTAAHHNSAALNRGISTIGGYLALTPEICRMVWPDKFKPELPLCYDGWANPTEFLLLYNMSIHAAMGDDRVMANWFAMALKEDASASLLNLPKVVVSSWEDLCK